MFGDTMQFRVATTRVMTAAVAAMVTVALGPPVGAAGIQNVPSSTTPGSTTTTTPPGGPTTTPPGGPTTTPPGGPTTTAPISYQAPPIDVASLSRLLVQRRAAAVALTQAGADAANAAAVTSVAAARDRLGAVQAEVADADTAVVAARQARKIAAADVDAARRTLAAAVVETYQLADTAGDPVSARLGDMLNGLKRFNEYSHATTYSQAALVSLQRRVHDAVDQLERRGGELDRATATRRGLDRDISGASAAATEAERSAAEVASAGTAAVDKARTMGDDLLVSGPEGPTVLGPSVVSAADMAAFAVSRGTPDPSIDMTALAGYYLTEGAAEGVRGDIAFVQSILETGAFSFAGSKVHTADHNYAGIGACDSCAGGTGYPTAELGVRAQIQLLRIYSTKGLTIKDLANPPAGRAPEQVSVRGCCDTWMRLSGKWATGPGYGVKILTIYNDMLAFAAARAPAPPSP